MKKILIIVIILICFFTIFNFACNSENIKEIDQNLVNNNIIEVTKELKESNMKINVNFNENLVVFELNSSNAAKELYSMLPLEVAVENFSNNEKIFYLPKKLDTKNTSLANAKIGTLAYYAPWGNVVMFYGDFGSASGLYELGKVVIGSEHIKNMSGTIKISK
jgi:hypothetical protein